MKKTTCILLLAFVSSLALGQKNYFSNPIDMFSKKKTSYITLTDGTELIGNLKKINRKKGLFEGITISVDDKKHKLDAEDISHMYLHPSGLQKLGDVFDLTDDDEKLVDHSMNSELLDEGYVFFQQAECYYKKKKKQVLLLQLLNAGFSGKVKVFHNPMGMESGGLALGGFQVSGGNEKSYFIKKGDNVAFKLKKKDYDDTAGELFGDCEDYFDTIKSDLSWGDLGKHILEYSESCE